MVHEEAKEFEELSLENLHKEINVKFSRYELVATINAKNTTPWWGGGPEAFTHIVSDNEVRVWLPTSETIKGGLRWVLRAAIGNVCNKISEVDHLLSEFLGGTKKIGKREEHFCSKVRIEVESYADPKYINELKNALTNGELKSFIDQCNRIAQKYKSIKLIDLLEILGWCLYWTNKGRVVDTNLIKSFGLKRFANNAFVNDIKHLLNAILSNDLLKHIVKLFTIPRVKMIFMGSALSAEELLKKIPTPPNTIGISIRVYVDKFCNNREDIAKLAILSLVFLLYARGIGKGVTRGFGRFRIEHIDCDEEIKGIVNSLNSVDAKRIQQALEDLKEKLISLAEKVFRLTRSTNVLRIPDLHSVQIRPIIANAKHPFPYPIRAFANATKLHKVPIDDVYEALSAISYAVMKNTWKLIARHPVRSVGAAFHTWILGLPRYQQKQKTGYVSINELSPKVRSAVRNVIQNRCTTVCIHESALRGTSLRRQSPILLFPIEKSIVMIVFRTIQDHARILSEEFDKMLLHVGRHGKPEKARCRQVSPVIYVATCNTLSNSNYCIDRGLGCGNVSPCGIMSPPITPHVHTQAITITDVVNQVLDSAVAFIEYALR